MNSLEFINDRIRSYETMLLTAIDTKCSKKQIKHYEEILNVFKQIKSELEAWEVVKPYVDIIDKYTPYPTWQLKTNYDECKLKETNILIKALEVKE